MAQKPKFLNESRKQNWNFLRDKGEGVEGRGKRGRGKGFKPKKKTVWIFSGTTQ